MTVYWGHRVRYNVLSMDRYGLHLVSAVYTKSCPANSTLGTSCDLNSQYLILPKSFGLFRKGKKPKDKSE